MKFQLIFMSSMIESGRLLKIKLSEFSDKYSDKFYFDQFGLIAPQQTWRFLSYIMVVLKQYFMSKNHLTKIQFISQKPKV